MSRRRLLFAGLNALLLGLLLLTVARGVRAAAALRRDHEAARAVRPGADRNLGLDGVVVRAAGGAPLNLGDMDAGLLLVFDPDCGPCGANMWNWTDLVRALHPAGVPVVALTLETVADTAGYWRGLDDEVAVATADTATLRDRLRAASTPATLLVERGAIRREYVGPLTARARDEILARLAPGARREGR